MFSPKTHHHTHTQNNNHRLVAPEDRLRLLEELLGMMFRSQAPLEDRNLVLKARRHI